VDRYFYLINRICKKYQIALCYLFGSQKDTGMALLKGDRVELVDQESDIDFGVIFKVFPQNPLEAYALLSLDLQDLISPFRVDLLFMHEVDHLIQLEAIKGINIYSISEEYKETYEEKVMMFASDELEIFKLNEKDMFKGMEDGYFEFKYKIN